MFKMSDIRKFAQGVINESTLKSMAEEDKFDLEDEEFINECTEIAMPIIIAGELMDENSEKVNEALNEAYTSLDSYLKGQGLINESFAINNPKINFVRLNKESQIKRLSKIFTLKFARKNNDKSYKKFKLGHLLKKNAMADMFKRYGTKAEALARRIWSQTKNHSKITAVVDTAKTKLKKAA